MREKLCFVISLATGLYAVSIFFLSGCFSLAREHQLWSNGRINTKRWEIHGGSVYSCIFHVWNSWLCNTGKLYVAAKMQSCSSFFCWFESLSISYPVKINIKRVKLVKSLFKLLLEAMIRWNFFLSPCYCFHASLHVKCNALWSNMVIQGWFISESGIPLEHTLTLRLQHMHPP